MVAQIEGVPIATPLPVIFASDPFAALSQVVGGGSSLVVTPSSIPTSTTQMQDMLLPPNKGSDKTPRDSDVKPAEGARCGHNVRFQGVRLSQMDQGKETKESPLSFMVSEP